MQQQNLKMLQKRHAGATATWNKCFLFLAYHQHETGTTPVCVFLYWMRIMNDGKSIHMLTL